MEGLRRSVCVPAVGAHLAFEGQNARPLAQGLNGDQRVADSGGKIPRIPGLAASRGGFVERDKQPWKDVRPAAHTALPVIGVPLTSKTSVAGGLDALLSISQMPPGVPVACVGVDNARNAAVLASRIIGA